MSTPRPHLTRGLRGVGIGVLCALTSTCVLQSAPTTSAGAASRTPTPSQTSREPSTRALELPHDDLGHVAKAQTLAGVSGRAGHAGPADSPVGVVPHWTSFRDFMFEYNRADLQPSDTSKVAEVAAYLNQNPSLQVGIDGSMDPRGTEPRNQDLSDRRVSAVRNALIQAGVPSHKILAGAFGDGRLARDRRVEVLIRTAN